jgi:hypothetical protein
MLFNCAGIQIHAFGEPGTNASTWQHPTDREHRAFLGCPGPSSYGRSFVSAIPEMIACRGFP